MKLWNEKRVPDLLHTPRREWPQLIAKRVETRGRISCAYCGQVDELGGLSSDERNARMLKHISECPKRPEMKLLWVALAAAEVAEVWGAPLDYVEAGRALNGPMERLRAALDKLKPGDAQ
jgi:hypothetical protein